METAVKLILTWDINPEHEQEYFEFVLGEFVPGLQRLGLQPSDAWVTAFGNSPQIQVNLLAESLELARVAVNSSGWGDLHDKLFTFISNYGYKIVPLRGGFQF